MTPDQIVQNVFSALDAKDFDRALSLITDDFAHVGATPVPVNKHQWIGVVRALTTSMSDFSFNYKTASVDGNKVSGTVSLTGTHDGEMVPPMPNLPRVAATGRKIALPTEPLVLTVRDGQLSSLHVENVSNGGFLGILKQMGAMVPQP